MEAIDGGQLVVAALQLLALEKLYFPIFFNFRFFQSKTELFYFIFKENKKSDLLNFHFLLSHLFIEGDDHFPVALASLFDFGQRFRAFELNFKNVFRHS